MGKGCSHFVLWDNDYFMFAGNGSWPRLGVNNMTNSMTPIYINRLSMK